MGIGIPWEDIQMTIKKVPCIKSNLGAALSLKPAVFSMPRTLWPSGYLVPTCGAGIGRLVHHPSGVSWGSGSC